jgi:PBP1b-binding outer membrane lipoprotein LpoB
MKKMKNLIAIGLVAIMMSSCATVFGGKVTAHQKTKPKAGEEQRQVRVVALIADILLFWPGAIVDFATGAIYKPQK